MTAARARGLTVLAPAKLNLSLRVLGPRPDGYHELDAPTVPLDLCDAVTAILRADRRIVSAWRMPGVAPRRELAWRAARLLADEARPDRGVEISVAKHIPAGAGLGGGSSDAAAALLACNRLWNLGWSRARLAALGLRLGADVPFFVYCRQARLRGRGEVLAPLRPPRAGWAGGGGPAGAGGDRGGLRGPAGGEKP